MGRLGDADAPRTILGIDADGWPAERGTEMGGLGVLHGCGYDVPGIFASGEDVVWEIERGVANADAGPIRSPLFPALLVAASGVYALPGGQMGGLDGPGRVRAWCLGWFECQRDAKAKYRPEIGLANGRFRLSGDVLRGIRMWGWHARVGREKGQRRDER